MKLRGAEILVIDGIGRGRLIWITTMIERTHSQTVSPFFTSASRGDASGCTTFHLQGQNKTVFFDARCRIGKVSSPRMIEQMLS
jgi:hypothetical protein